MLSADFFSMMTYYSSHTENEVYYYHNVLCGSRAQSQACLSCAEMQQSVRSKHLGSTAYLTNDSGQVSQVLNYLPYGEDWVEIHNITTLDTTRLGMYRFNGKEKDYESGFHYYGARYYWSEVLTGWLSVDPMSDKYPSISPYAYCHWNPIKLVDPDGQEDWEVDKLGHITKCQEQQENPTEDRIRIKGTTGWTEKNSISGLKRFTITDPVTVPLENASTDYGSLISMGGTEDDRLNVFKFCASNANVEFSLLEIDDGNNHLSYLTTSHDEHLRRKEKIGDGLGSAVAVKFFDKLQLHIHNHFTGKVGWGPNEDDYAFKENINNLRDDYQQKNPDANLPEVKFMIYKCRGNDKQTISY